MTESHLPTSCTPCQTPTIKQMVIKMPASVALLDARPTGDQGVAGSTPAGLAHSFVEIWSSNIFYGHSLISADSRRAVVSFWRKDVHNSGKSL